MYRREAEDYELARAHRIEDEQVAHCLQATPHDLLQEIWDRVMPVLTHAREASSMRVPVDHEHDDDAYVGMRLRELMDRFRPAPSKDK